MTKILLFLTGLSTGLILGFSVAAWALYEPIPVGPAKYGFNHAPGPVPPYTMDGSRKLMRIDCISASAKDCPQPITIPQPVAIPVPGTLWLMLLGLGGIAVYSSKKMRIGGNRFSCRVGLSAALVCRNTQVFNHEKGERAMKTHKKAALRRHSSTWATRKR